MLSIGHEFVKAGLQVGLQTYYGEEFFRSGVFDSDKRKSIWADIWGCCCCVCTSSLRLRSHKAPGADAALFVACLRTIYRGRISRSFRRAYWPRSHPRNVKYCPQSPLFVCTTGFKIKIKSESARMKYCTMAALVTLWRPLADNIGSRLYGGVPYKLTTTAWCRKINCCRRCALRHLNNSSDAVAIEIVNDRPRKTRVINLEFIVSINSL